MLDYEALPPRTAAALCYGLRDTARVKMKLAGMQAGFDRQLLAIIADRLGMLWWAKTEDARENRNRPPSILSMLTGEDDSKHTHSFASPEAFEAARQRIIKEAAHERSKN
ncbi:MAG: hypothetical protein IIZ83_06860 [Oscillospiraceae bacterium]|nr:hypothetical protein [Oscillospiraceae bacterium]